MLPAAAYSGFGSSPDFRTRRALLHLSYSCAPPFGPATLVTHDPTRTSDRLMPGCRSEGARLRALAGPPSEALCGGASSLRFLAVRRPRGRSVHAVSKPERYRESAGLFSVRLPEASPTSFHTMTVSAQASATSATSKVATLS